MDQQQEDMWVKTGVQLAAARKMLAALYSSQDMLDEVMRTVADNDSADMIDAIMQENRKAIIAAEATGLSTGERE